VKTVVNAFQREVLDSNAFVMMDSLGICAQRGSTCVEQEILVKGDPLVLTLNQYHFTSVFVHWVCQAGNAKLQ